MSSSAKEGAISYQLELISNGSYQGNYAEPELTVAAQARRALSRVAGRLLYKMIARVQKDLFF